jgi:hypothetical protein
MLGETGGVRTYTPGRGNFEAAKQDSKLYVAKVRKAEIIAVGTAKLRRASS